MPPKDSESHTILTIFGITGDLAALKIVPALWQLFHEGKLPDRFQIIGFARRELDLDAFRKIIADSIEKNIGARSDSDEFRRFFELFLYHRGTFEDAEAYHALRSRIGEMEVHSGMCANKLFYLAVPPASYESIFKNLGEAGLNIPCDDESGWSRILIEKPFGADLASARALGQALDAHFDEHQIYRVDHYNFKDPILEMKRMADHAWDNTMIERIDVRLEETVGVEARGAFYDSVGALCDVGQNHVLSMLAEVTLRDRAEMLQSLRPWTEEMLKRDTFRSQYAGYRGIKGVDPESETETHFSILTEFTHPEWAGIPIHLEAGKRMPVVRKEIVVTRKEGEPIVLRFDTTDEAYAKMILAAMRGEREPFISEAEVEASWKFVDPIMAAWKRDEVPLETYEPN